MAKIDYMRVLTEAGTQMDRPMVLCMNEASQIQVSEDVLSGMMKFITDKYNSLDFDEIEKSAGDITRFKYTGMLLKNADMLKNIYANSADPGAKKYMKVADAVLTILNHLDQKRTQYSTLYKSGNGLVQMLYTSMVASCIYSIGILVSNTIRFVTTEQDTDCQVLYDEIPGSIKNVHIKNALSAAEAIPDITKLLNSYERGATPIHEAVYTGIVAGALAVAGVIYLIPKILVMIREIIYSIYFLRIKVSDMLSLQIDLINTNIEALNKRNESGKIIAKQSKVVEKLEKWKNRIAVKVDSVNALVIAQKRKEVQALRVEPNSPIARAPEDFSPTDLMI